MEQRTWRERDGSSSCKCVRWGIGASQNTILQTPLAYLSWASFILPGWSAYLDYIFYSWWTGGHSFLCLFNPVPLMEKYISLDLNMSVVIESQN